MAIFNGKLASQFRRRVRAGKPPYTQADVAKRLGVSRQAVNVWERGPRQRGNYQPTREHIEQMAEMYGVEPDEMMIVEQPAGA